MAEQFYYKNETVERKREGNGECMMCSDQIQSIRSSHFSAENKTNSQAIDLQQCVLVSESRNKETTIETNKKGEERKRRI